MQIFICTAIGTTGEPPIRNRHFDPVGTRSDSEIFDSAPKLLSGSLVEGCRCDRDKTSFRGRKTFVSHSKIVIPADDLPVSKVFSL
ncbi:hypothetical protein Taro_007248 [Colocasia esculenta]|uniref:Uncharacterized protein n=1 Tax=Colocasia esculenta TaxID=4460 RepID=A0A843TQW1_COLES|nr:hypothetical protein [Colocasia esculenta]